MGIWRGVSVAPAKARPSADLRANASAAMAAMLFGLLGLVLFALFPLTFNIGLQYTEDSRGAAMLATMPIWSALLGRIIGERLARRQIVGVGCSVAGIALAFLEPGRVVGGDA